MGIHLHKKKDADKLPYDFVVFTEDREEYFIIRGKSVSLGYHQRIWIKKTKSPKRDIIRVREAETNMRNLIFANFYVPQDG